MDKKTPITFFDILTVNQIKVCQRTDNCNNNQN